MSGFSRTGGFGRGWDGGDLLAILMDVQKGEQEAPCYMHTYALDEYRPVTCR